MIDKYQLFGYWITPDSRYFNTNNVINHYYVIENVLNIKDSIINDINNLKKEHIIDNFGQFDQDIAFLSMVLGNIRIIYGYNQFCIEYIKEITEKQLNIIEMLFKSHCREFNFKDNIYLEYFCSENVKNVSTIEELRRIIENKQYLFKNY